MLEKDKEFVVFAINCLSITKDYVLRQDKVCPKRDNGLKFI